VQLRSRGQNVEDGSQSADDIIHFSGNGYANHHSGTVTY